MTSGTNDPGPEASYRMRSATSATAQTVALSQQAERQGPRTEWYFDTLEMAERADRHRKAVARR